MPYLEPGTAGWQAQDTSRNAAEAAIDKSAAIQMQVLLLKRASGPLTSEQIARALQLPYESVQPRISELKNGDRIADSGVRKPGRLGRPIIAWVAIRKEN